jgi:hypothetical protein
MTFALIVIIFSSNFLCQEILDLTACAFGTMMFQIITLVASANVISLKIKCIQLLKIVYKCKPFLQHWNYFETFSQMTSGVNFTTFLDVQ